MTDESTDNSAPAAAPKNKGGRPPGSGKLQRAGRSASARFQPAPRPEPEMERGEPRLERGRLTRRRRVTDKLAVDKRLKRDGYAYEWKSKSVAGQPEAMHISDLKENHWREVPADRVPGATVEQKGLVLMERPAYLNQDAIEEDYGIAMDQVHSVTDRLSNAKPNTLSRDGRRVVQVNRTVERPIPEE